MKIPNKIEIQDQRLTKLGAAPSTIGIIADPPIWERNETAEEDENPTRPGKPPP